MRDRGRTRNLDAMIKSHIWSFLILLILAGDDLKGVAVKRARRLPTGRPGRQEKPTAQVAA
jgi:hypothetical protein